MGVSGPGCGVCDPASATDCVDGVCQCGQAEQAEVCENTEVCCGGQCVDLQSDREHCGSCDQKCDDPAEWYDTRACEQGTCELVSCPEGWANCVPQVLGCETQLGTQDHCERCNHDCGSDLVCVDQKCVSLCSAEYLCDTNGWDCGSHSTDECGTVDCGGCSDHQQCSEGICVCRPADQICNLYEVVCGDLPTPDCGNIACDNCPPYHRCSDGDCVCSAEKICQANSRDCGSISMEDCGTVSCGSCSGIIF